MMSRGATSARADSAPTHNTCRGTALSADMRALCIKNKKRAEEMKKRAEHARPLLLKALFSPKQKSSLRRNEKWDPTLERWRNVSKRLSKVLHLGQTLPIVTLCSAGYLHWLEHLHRNLLLLRLSSRLAVCAADNRTASFARNRSLKVLPVGDRRQHEAALSWGTKGYANVTRLKAHCVLAFMTQPHAPSGFIFTDTDVTFLASPRPHMPARADIALLDDTGPTQRQNNTLNSGFFFSRNTLPMRRFWGALIKYHANIPQLADQVALNVMLSRSPGLRVARLDPMRFVNGFRFYEQNRSRGEPRRNSSAVVLVHHNWIRGDAQKFARAVAYDTIPRAGEGRVHFLRRARHAIVRKEAWAPPLLLFGLAVKELISLAAICVAAAVLLFAASLAVLSCVAVRYFNVPRADVAHLWLGDPQGERACEIGFVHVMIAILLTALIVLLNTMVRIQ